MKNNRARKYIILSILGFILFITGLALAIFLPEKQSTIYALQYIFIGVGAGIFGGSLGYIHSKQVLKKDPKVAKQLDINSNDERIIAINSRAKAKSYDLMVLVYGLLLLVFALMQVDLYILLVFVAAYLFAIFSMIYYFNKYNKEM